MLSGFREVCAPPWALSFELRLHQQNNFYETGFEGNAEALTITPAV